MARRFKVYRWMAAAGLAAAVALAAACGGSDDGADSGGSPGGGDKLTTASRNRDDAATGQGATVPDARAPGEGETLAAGDGASGGGTQALPSQLDRKIIHVATVDLTTDNVSRGFEDVGNIAARHGGIVGSSSFGYSEDRQTASMTIKVPSDRYQSALSDLRQLGEIRSETSNANDVTEEFTDLNSRLRNLQATERQYLEFLARAANIGEVLQVQDRLSAARAEIEQVQGRINLLDNSTELATITVHLNPPAVAKDEPKADGGRPSPREVVADAFDASIYVLNGALIVVLAVAAFSWWMAPLAVVGYVIARRLARPRERAAPAAPTTPAA